MTTVTAVRFVIPCYIGEWDASYDGVIADKHGCVFTSQIINENATSVILNAPSLEAAEAFVTEIFSCDHTCEAEELMIIL